MNKLDPQALSNQDLRESVPLMNYLFILGAWRREIVLGALLAAIGGGALMQVVRILFPRYEASSFVAILRAKSNVSIDEKFSTAATTTRRRGERILDRVARRAGLVGLVESGDVSVAVLKRVEGELEEKEAHPTRLLERIRSELVTIGVASSRNTSDLIRLTAHAGSPKVAQSIANVWAEEYVNLVNKLYTNTPEEQVQTLLDEIEHTAESYKAAQKELESFVSNSKIGPLQNEIAMQEEAVAELNSIKMMRIKGEMLNSKVLEAHKLKIFEESVEAEGKKHAEIHQSVRDLERSIMRATDLRIQIERGNEQQGLSSIIPLLLLKAETYSSGTSRFETLDIDLKDFSDNELQKPYLLTELDAIIAAGQNRLKKLNARLESLPTSLEKFWNVQSIQKQRQPFLFTNYISNIITAEENPLNGKESNPSALLEEHVSRLEVQIQQMKAKVETERDRHEILVQNRDVHRSALESLRSEIAELRLAMSTFTSEVRVASYAPTPIDPVGPSALLIGCLSGIFTLLSIGGFAFLANSAGMPPLLEKQGGRPGPHVDAE